MNVDLVPLEIISVGETFLAEVANVFGRRRRLRYGYGNGLNLLHDLSVLHHVADDDLLRLALLVLTHLLLNLLLLLRLLLHDRLLRLLLLRESPKEKERILKSI